ncbi:hypothetical protein WCD74_15085 [Actinomycetospora sp. OC33-EN08]|uniref:Uncharacterized protein n=1 Tax=Actinomycetospora aurantiaca TaxID=3129233 RepID=A0ABU8MPB5_9PSEU
MAKNKKTPDTTSTELVPVASPATPAAAPQPTFADQVGEVVTGSVRTVRGVLPTRRLPVYLAGAALAVTGLVEAPGLIAAGLAYEALRRWEPAPAAH